MMHSVHPFFDFEVGVPQYNPLNMPIQQQQQTTDGPAAIIFEADPKITDIFTCKDGDYFGLVLVTNWPNTSSSSSSWLLFFFFVGGRNVAIVICKCMVGYK